jgi:hypothetical protein
MNSVNRLPVPSIPGSNTSLARVLDTELMLAGVLDLVCLKDGDFGTVIRVFWMSYDHVIL